MKKVLFISYYWPPSGKATLHWPFKIIKHLPEFGWQPIVLTVTEDTFSEKDESLLNDIDSSLKVFRAKSFEPFNIYKIVTGKRKNAQLVASETISKTNKSFTHRLSLWIRMNLFIPDARIGWYLPAVKQGTKILLKEKVDTIVSVGPPHSSHLIAKKLSKKFNLPHVPVFIDPWVDIAYYGDLNRSKLTIKIDSHLEKSVLENSKAVVFVTQTMCKDYERKYPSIKNRAHVLYWGYSEEDFKLPSSNKLEVSKAEQIILHAGNIFDFQNPVHFWETIKAEIERSRKIKLKFIGTVGPEIKKSINNAGLGPFTEYKGFLPYKEMLNEMLTASSLLVCASEPRHVPGKLFEYLRAGKPIIAFGDGNEEVKRILTEANAGMMFSYNDSAIEFFKNSNRFSTDQNYVKSFERRIIAENLNEILSKFRLI